MLGDEPPPRRRREAVANARLGAILIGPHARAGKLVMANNVEAEQFFGILTGFHHFRALFGQRRCQAAPACGQDGGCFLAIVWIVDIAWSPIASRPNYLGFGVRMRKVDMSAN
ncbi:hypothetical protein RA307_02460 [Xanthobacteraceae bacterium Astr-EGSB]|uniref:hypothetical protein n=1 Tax=Astrobacterium formosum TaxID=3069710 RepID=UPI0027B7BF2E|nr:hypothetical protein [Xanthobacteraceae bacterium Astr-EGSB]